MSMEKVITTIALAAAFVMLSVVETNAQKDDCKYQTNEVDKFTKKKILATKWDRFTKFMAQPTFVSGIAEGDKKYVGIKIVSTSNSSQSKPSNEDVNNSISSMYIPMGAKITVLMADQSTIELKTEQETRGTWDYTAPH